jgi:hypothetical protein
MADTADIQHFDWRVSAFELRSENRNPRYIITVLLTSPLAICSSSSCMPTKARSP